MNVPVANMCLSGVVIDVNISLLPLVSIISYLVIYLEHRNVEDIEKINEEHCIQTIWLCRGLSIVSLVKI